jgi:anthranilate phosphoribosyltransferase
MTSHCGSADVLEALGVKIDLGPEGVQYCLQKAGIGFMFAQVFHPAMRHAAGPRREIGIRTVFNILGPVTNPAGASAQVVGVTDGAVAPKMAEVLRKLGCRHGLVTHGEEGLDEVSISGKTLVWEVRGDDLASFEVAPEDFGLLRADIAEIRGGSADENAAMLRDVLGGASGPKRDIVLLNAAAGLVAGDLTPDLSGGIEIARETIGSGRALQKLEEMIAVSQAFAQA